MDYSIKIGGEAGQGIQTIGDALARVFARTGFHIFSFQDYESRVRGGHNFYQIRLSDTPITTFRDKVDIIVALDRDSVALHERELTDGGRILYDSSSIKAKHEGPSFLDIPFEKLALERGGDRIMANTVATGAVIGMLGMELTRLITIISEAFAKKGEAVITANRNAAHAGYEYAVNNCKTCSFSVPGDSAGNPKLLVGGAEAI